MSPETVSWQDVEDELRRWEASGDRPEFWLRDDDAVEPSEPFDRLIALAGKYRIPIVLAVIPQAARDRLGRLLAGTASIRVAQHGWRHANHAPESEKKQELGAHRPVELVMAELAEGKSKLDRLFGNQVVPMLVPPWNRIDPIILPHLGTIGISAVSAYGDNLLEFATPDLHIQNTHIDIMDWKTRQGHSEPLLLARLLDELRERRLATTNAPVGILTHHLVHDEAAWRFLDRLFAITTAKERCRWLRGEELFG